MSRASRRAPTTEPMTMPAMAPAESPWLVGGRHADAGTSKKASTAPVVLHTLEPVVHGTGLKPPALMSACRGAGRRVRMCVSEADRQTD